MYIIKRDDAVIRPDSNMERTTAMVSNSPITVSLSFTSKDDKLASGDKKPNHSITDTPSSNKTALRPESLDGSKLASVNVLKIGS